jgi:hypothetical protein
MSTGMKSFLLDTQLDDKVRLVRARYGNNGFANLILIWMKIYRDEGYWMRWDEDSISLFASEDGHWDKGKLNRMISECVNQGLFSSEKLMQYQVLTSAAIQKRYFKYRSRSAPYEVEKCLLCDPASVSAYKNVKLVCKKFKSACNFNTTRFDLIRHDKEEDIGNFENLDANKLKKALSIYVQREASSYGPSSEYLFKNMVSTICDIACAIPDPTVIYNLNHSSEIKIEQLWTIAKDIMHPIDDGIEHKTIGNERGYLYRTMMNLFQESES